MPTVTKEDPAVIMMHRITVIDGVEKHLQQGVYSKADLLAIKTQIEAILTPPAPTPTPATPV